MTLLLLFYRTHITGALLYTFILGIILPMNLLYGVVTMQLSSSNLPTHGIVPNRSPGRRVVAFALGRITAPMPAQPALLRRMVWLYLPLALLVIRDVIFFYKAAKNL